MTILTIQSSDEYHARSVVIGHEVKRRVEEHWKSKGFSYSFLMLEEVQRQSELAYLQAVEDIYISLLALREHDSTNKAS